MLPKKWHGGITAIGEYYDFYVNDTDLYQGKESERQAWRFALALMRQQPAFARIRRIWETTLDFWQQIEAGLPGIIGKVGPRLEIRGEISSSRIGKKLVSSHAYELVLARGLHLNAIWEEENNRFLTAANLERLSNLLDWDGNGSYLNALKLNISGKIDIEEPIGYSGANRRWGWININDIREIPDSSYAPAVPILAEPGQFMSLVPAENSLYLVNAIYQKYQKEMGKVANRLPLRLGVVFAQQHTPLRTVLDAGRRLLVGKGLPGNGWTVNENAGELAENLSEDPHYKQYKSFTLTRDGRKSSWVVPLAMGDGQTLDAWYPYAAVVQASRSIRSILANGISKPRIPCRNLQKCGMFMSGICCQAIK